jgi:tetratricopeptide (TPR) repeat protein
MAVVDQHKGAEDDPGKQRQCGMTTNAMIAGTVVGPVVQAGLITGGVQFYPPHQVPTPRQLPACPAGFVGRAGEQTALTNTLDHGAGGGTVLISALAGAGGIGKTWLALHWAHEHVDQFPDGQLFVDLRGFSPAGAPIPAAEAVRGFLDAFGVAPGRIPTDLDAQARLYRSLVAGKRMLIVLDNAATDEQIEPLLPGSETCTVLVTSRKILTALITRYGARQVPVTILDQDEAHTLLAQRLGNQDARLTIEPDAAVDIIRLCGRYPLALTITAARAQTRLRVPLTEFATELRELGLGALDNFTTPAASLPAVLSLSLRDLTPQQRTVFALLGIAPGRDISLAAAASLIGLSNWQAAKILGALEEASLLDRHPASRYAMHDLIRAYAITTARDLTDDTREAALRRVLDFYIHTAHTADRLLDPHRMPTRLDPPVPGTHPHPLPNISAALVWLDAEHSNLLAIQHIAITYHWHHTVWQLALTLDTFHYRRGHRHDRLRVWQAAMDAAARSPDPTISTRAHQLLGRAYADLGLHEEATGHLHRALALAEHHRDPTQQALTHQALAWAWGLQGDDRRALDHATQAKDLFRTLDQPVREARALNTVGWHAARLGEYGTARAHCQAALPLHRLHLNPDGEAATLDSLGYIEHQTGHHHHALYHYQHALTLYRNLGNTLQSANTLDRLGYPYAALGQHDHARTAWREALELYRLQGRDEDAARVQRQLDKLDTQHDRSQ